ncbi:hypothetical protein JOE63_000952 [Cellulosimicrobium cellulans]|nr:hypothetical protein [Cellulosimicrobium cellulans]
MSSDPARTGPAECAAPAVRQPARTTAVRRRAAR